jgi:hypothetical protein
MEKAETSKLRFSRLAGIPEIALPAAPRMTEGCFVMMFICDHCSRRRGLGKRVDHNSGATLRLG